MLNKVLIAGRLTEAPEMRKTQSDISVTSITVAVQRDYKAKNGERETDFLNVVAWDKTAELVCKYFNKGQMIIICGRIETRKYTDAQGKNRKAVDIVADNVYFCGDSKSATPDGYVKPTPNTAPSYSNTNYDTADIDGDLPFN